MPLLLDINEVSGVHNASVKFLLKIYDDLLLYIMP